MDLKQLAESLGLPPDATEAQVTESIAALKKSAAASGVWKARAEDNLRKIEEVGGLAKENDALKADIFMAKQKAAFKITAAEEIALKKMYLSGPDGKAAVEELIAARADQEYLTRAMALQDVKAPPSNPLAEIESKARELMAKDATLSLGDAQSKVLKADYELFCRYNAARSGGAL